MKIGFQIQAPRNISRNNSTLLIMEEAQKRGFELFHFKPEDLNFDGKNVFTQARPLSVDLESEIYVRLGEAQAMSMSELDAVLVRQEPIIDITLVTNTYILEQAKEQTWVINDPASVRRHPEKIDYFGFEEYVPPTLISADTKAIRDFWDEHKDIVIKPLFYYGGKGVFRIKENDTNLGVTVETLTELNNCPVIAQKFIKSEHSEVKRVLIIFGEISGAYSRRPKGKSIRTRAVRGVPDGETTHKCDLTPAQRDISKRLAKTLLDEKIYIAGVDFIDDFLIEINLITPGGFIDISKIYNEYPQKQLWDIIEKQVKNGQWKE